MRLSHRPLLEIQMQSIYVTMGKRSDIKMTSKQAVVDILVMLGSSELPSSSITSYLPL